MMYLSQLMIDVGSNPDRPRPGRLWLRNLYRVHQRLSMAFPNPKQLGEDPAFLKPYNPAGFPENGKGPRFLFRVDNNVDDDGPRVVIVVQSNRLPDWNYAFHNAPHFLAAPPQTREYAPRFPAGDLLRFRLRVNPTKKSKAPKSRDGAVELRKSSGEIDSHGRQKDQGKRISLTWKSEEGEGPDQVIRDWFATKAARSGFELQPDAFTLLHLGWGRAWRSLNKSDSDADACPEQQMRFRSALLEGRLKVTDPEVFSQTIENGIGTGKAFGFGLLSVIRCMQ